MVTRLPIDGVFYLPINYALKEVAEALEDEIAQSPPSSMGHQPIRQQSGTSASTVVTSYEPDSMSSTLIL